MTPSGGGASMVALDLRYHVPRSQVWQGSRGGQRGNVHLYVPRIDTTGLTYPEILEVHERGRLAMGRVSRIPGQALCGRSAWYPRGLDARELDALPTGLCPRCVELAGRLDPPELIEHMALGPDYPGATVAYNITRARIAHATAASDRFGA